MQPSSDILTTHKLCSVCAVMEWTGTSMALYSVGTLSHCGDGRETHRSCVLKQ